jgi:hypothetical protein
MASRSFRLCVSVTYPILQARGDPIRPNRLKFHTPPASKQGIPPAKARKAASHLSILSSSIRGPAAIGTCVFRVACMRTYY